MSKLFLGVLAAVVASPAAAAVTLVTVQTDDIAFEGLGGFLQTHYNLPNPVSGTTVLPPLERAVGQVKTGTNKRRGLHVPTAATGLPAPDGTGVTQALTNVGALGGGTDTNFVSGTPVAFSISRLGTTVTYSVGSDSWSQSKGYFADINGFEIRFRSNVPTIGTPTNSLAVTGLLFNDAVTVNQSLADFSATDGAVAIRLWSGIGGDFTIGGDYILSWTGSQPTGARLASQLKLLALPAEPGGVPEPSTWALLILGFGLTGAAMRRRVLAS